MSSSRGDAPPGFAEVLATAMASSREQRYPSVRAFAEALAAFTPHDGGFLLRPVAEARVPTVLEPGLASHVPGITAADARGNRDSSLSQAPQRSKRLLLSGLVAFVAVSILIATLWARSWAGKNDAELAREGAPVSSGVAKAEAGPDSSASADNDKKGPEVLSVVGPAEDPPATAPVTEPNSRHSQPRPKASNDSPTPVHKTRATQHGLAEDNPFGR